MDIKRIVGSIQDVERIARGTGVRVSRRLNKAYGRGNWRKMKGTARIELLDGTIRIAELHWYEAHGIGKKEITITRLLWPAD